MTQAIIARKINKTAEEIHDLIAKSKRKMFELEVLISASEVKRGKKDVYKNASQLLKAVMK